MAVTEPPHDAEANVSQITDEQWLAGHRALMEHVADDPAFLAELGYLYDPERDPATVTAADLTTDRDPGEPDEVST